MSEDRSCEHLPRVEIAGINSGESVCVWVEGTAKYEDDEQCCADQEGENRPFHAWGLRTIDVTC